MLNICFADGKLLIAMHSVVVTSTSIITIIILITIIIIVMIVIIRADTRPRYLTTVFLRVPFHLS